jgi:hypothetical protein
MSKAQDLIRLTEEIDMGQADRTLRRGTKSSGKYAVVDGSGEVVSTHNDQGSAMTAALKNDTYTVKPIG